MVVGTYAAYVSHFLLTPLANRQGVVMNIASGTSVRVMAAQLVQAGVLRHPLPFRLANLPPFNHPPLQAGEYLMTPGMTGEDLLHKLRMGLVIQHKLTIVEGWTFSQLVNAMSQDPYLKHTLPYQNPMAVMAALGYPNMSPEGLFFPDTYLFAKGTPDTVILHRAYQHMQGFMAEVWPQRMSALPYQNTYDVLKAASLVEKESAYQPERPIIAGIIVSRLAANMPLQMDPSVIYGLGATYQGNLTRDNMRTDTPYNNYLYKGLPPTPIAFPSASAILAVLHPNITGALYFVAKGDGTHAFSQTLSDQDKAIVKYQLKPRQSTNKPTPVTQSSAS